MSENNTIRSHVEGLFAEAPKTQRAYELKEELIANLMDRYEDLIGQGKEPEMATNIVIAGIGDIDELIQGLREQNIFNRESMLRQRQKSAILISTAVALYIASFIFPILFCSGLTPVFNIGLGVSLMFGSWAVATFLIVYNALSKPKYVKYQDNIVEDFKEWKSGKSKEEVLLKTLQSIVWTCAVIIFFFTGFTFGLFYISWVVFLLAPVINQILKLVFLYREGQ